MPDWPNRGKDWDMPSLLPSLAMTAAPCVERYQSVGFHKPLEGFVLDPRILPRSAGTTYQVLAGM